MKTKEKNRKSLNTNQTYKLIGAVLIVSLSLMIKACSDPDEVGPVDCSLSGLTLVISETENVSTCNATDGTVRVSATGGKAPYRFSINNGPLQDGDNDGEFLFTVLGPGAYTILLVDADDCDANKEATVGAEGSTLSVSLTLKEDTGCTSNNGSITVEASGGVPPYQYSIDSNPFGDSPEFSNLNHGTYTVLIKDQDDCTISQNAQVPRGDTGTSYSATVQSIIQTSCAISGCHNGSSAQPNWTILSNVQAAAQNIKNRTSSKTMPPAGQTPLTDEEIALIACWVDDGAKDN